MRTTTTLFALLLLTGVSRRMFACSCNGQRTVQEEIKHADAVVVGKILSKQIVRLTDSLQVSLFPDDTTMSTSLLSKIAFARYDFLIEAMYKGQITNDTLSIYTGIGGGDCGIRFEIGKKYIVYGENNTYFEQINKAYQFPKAKNTIWTYSCLRTTSYFPEEIIEIEKYAKRQQLENDEVIFSDPDILPTYKAGGHVGLKKFINQNLRYPTTGECVSGKVYVGFMVDTLGNVKDIEIIRGITPAIDQEAIRVVKMLTFMPGKRFGTPIETKMVLPISFNLE